MSEAPTEIEGQRFAEFALERFTPGTFGPKSAYEHWSRYLFALRYVADRDVLDYGCGTGFGSRLMAGIARDVLALDVSGGAIRYASEHHPHPRCRFERCGPLPHDVPSASRDVVVCFEVVEHVHEQRELLQELARILRPDGVLLVSTPNPRYTATLGENPYHVRELDQRELVDLIGAHFDHAQTFVQTPLIGEAVWPEGGDAGVPARVHVLAHDRGRNCWDPATGPPGPEQTWVVVASDRPLPDPEPCLVSDADGRLLEDFREYVERLEGERRDLEAAIATTQRAAEEERGRLTTELAAERERHEREVGAEREAAGLAAEAAATARAAAAASEERVDAARAALAQSEDDLRRLRHHIIYLERKVGLRWVSWALRGAFRRLGRAAAALG